MLTRENVMYHASCAAVNENSVVAWAYKTVVGKGADYLTGGASGAQGIVHRILDYVIAVCAGNFVFHENPSSPEKSLFYKNSCAKLGGNDGEIGLFVSEDYGVIVGERLQLQRQMCRLVHGSYNGSVADGLVLVIADEV